MEHGSNMLRDGAILLAFGLACVLLFRKLGLGATLGYLVAGAVVGPQMLGLVGGAESMLGFAEFGITILLFLVGLELNPQRLWRLKHDIFGLGLLQVVLCGLGLTGVLVLARFSPAAALALGLPLALSSTAQVLPMLQSVGRLRTPFGERAFSVLLFQDLSIVPLIAILAAMSRAPANVDATPGWVVGVQTLTAVVGLVLAGRFLLRPLFRLIGRLGEREMFVFAGLFTVVASAALMASLGLSTALGAFIAGVMLADSPYRHELEADVEPFRSVLLGLFFLAVGMMLDLHAIADRPLFVLGMAAAVIGVKTGVIFALGLAFRMGWREALALGLLLSQGGEFGFVLFTQAQAGRLILPETASLFGAVVTVSMAFTPFLMRYTQRIRAEPEREEGAMPEGPPGDGASALVIGYGRFGQTVAQMLILQRIKVTLIDQDPEMIETAGTFGAKVYYGDGTRMDLLRQAGAAEAQLLLFCPNGDLIDADFLHGVAAAFPKASVFVRAYDRRSMIRIAGGPIAGAVREVIESAVCMARMAMAALEIDDDDIDRVEDEYRKRDEERLREQSDTGDLRAGIERIITENRQLAGES
ncbi:cation:proton antiporter [uncultured Sphingomonas sp.]|uniref:cation:proton antiporter domain-containing protein n=1 Tax=uncultured Sphingomonas sp. TaxID=158754 RepID=UPI0035CB99C5